ncbi:IclR family transcriptional regulator [Rhizobiaceae bacterium BDR2-2]|uniref:IclR family transcriptional regulator n=1 Tax=Ectorhizobium quercum TaxID=2965071 RepID=A0AAE3MZQ8_9HYPH|nr:IclR family transcriptional regulator [Ectorhizobium quercum]MCX8997446.1 IclR family transcriptional regulator [Ectorhizobium quercum]
MSLENKSETVSARRLEPADVTPDRTSVSIDDAPPKIAPARSSSATPREEEDGTLIQSVDRALTLLELLADAPQELRLQDLARMANLKTPTCHHILNTLVARGYASKLAQPRSYYLGPRVAELAAMRGTRFDIVREARPILQRLHAEAHARVRLAGFSGTALTVLCQFGEDGEPTEDLSSAAHATALGKAILAWLPETEIARVVADRGLVAFTANTIDNLGDLVESLRQVRRHGFAVEDREFRSETVAIGCAIRDRSGAVVGSISGDLQPAPPDHERLRILQTLISRSARELSALVP